MVNSLTLARHHSLEAVKAAARPTPIRSTPSRSSRRLGSQAPDSAATSRSVDSMSPDAGAEASFLPRFLHPPGDVAQLVEHLLCKQGVGGSSPLVSTK